MAHPLWPHSAPLPTPTPVPPAPSFPPVSGLDLPCRPCLAAHHDPIQRSPDRRVCHRVRPDPHPLVSRGARGAQVQRGWGGGSEKQFRGVHPPNGCRRRGLLIATPPLGGRREGAVVEEGTQAGGCRGGGTARLRGARSSVPLRQSTCPSSMDYVQFACETGSPSTIGSEAVGGGGG